MRSLFSSIVVLLAATAMTPPAFADKSKAEGNSLAGTVVTADGKPVSSARISLYTAAVRQGTSSFCPSCYADCAKTATTGDDGSFEIARLDPELVFQVLVVAEGFAPTFVNKVDPAAGPMRAVVSAVPPGQLDPHHTISGVVLGADNKPVVGASVESYGCKDGERRWWGSLPGVDPLAITNARGEFTFHFEHADLALDLQVNARGLAPKKFALLAAGGKFHVLRLTEGASVGGRLLIDGKPVSGVTVGIVQADRGCESYLGHVEIGTDSSGKFLFSNLAPDQDYFVYGTMESLGDLGAVKARTVHVGADGSMANAGDLNLAPAHQLAGQVVCSDGKPLPRRIRVTVSREDAWDAQVVELDAEGRFRVKGLPEGEQISLSVRVTGYHLSLKNRSLDRLNLLGLGGLINQDIVHLSILLEPGEMQPVSFYQLTKNEQQEVSDSFAAMKTRPLRGAEEAP